MGYIDLSATTFGVAQSNSNNNVKNSVFAYCFHSVDWLFKRLKSYTGNGSTDGPIVETGFEVQYIMIKRTDTAGHSWLIYDPTRSGSNFADDLLYANTNATENPLTDRFLFLSNGFQILTDNTSHNASGGEYIYIAFAADPDTETPTLAKSFNTVTYTGNGSTQTINGLSFKPGLIWMKRRDENIKNTL